MIDEAATYLAKAVQRLSDAVKLADVWNLLVDYSGKPKSYFASVCPPQAYFASRTLADLRGLSEAATLLQLQGALFNEECAGQRLLDVMKPFQTMCMKALRLAGQGEALWFFALLWLNLALKHTGTEEYASE